MAGDIGKGTKLLRGNGDGPPETFVLLGGVQDISPPSLSKDMIDVTDASSDVEWKEYMSGLKEAGDISLEVLLDHQDSGQQQLRSDFLGSDLHNYRVQFPDGSNWTMAAHVSNLEAATPKDSKMVYAVTLKPSGAPEFVDV